MVTERELEALVANSIHVHNAVREELLRPFPRKMPPRFSAAAIARLASVDPPRFAYNLKKANGPIGEIADGKRRRTWSLAETRQIVNAISKRPPRPKNVPGTTMCLVNFKGGSTKTSTAFNIAQGLSLRGRKVLVIDLDPQGSATVLGGFVPATELDEESTASMLFSTDPSDAPQNLDYSIVKTYWDGLDIVPGAPALSSAEMIIPAMSQLKLPWWDVLNKALDVHRKEYDHIIIDTPPSLSYLAICAIYASDSLLMPLPPEQLDFSASIAFWRNVTDMMSGIRETKGVIKTFKSVGVLLSRVRQTAATPHMRNVITQAYSPYLLNLEIPASDANMIGASFFGTVHDSVDEDGVSRFDSRLRAAFDELIDRIDEGAVANNWGARSVIT